MSSLSAYAGVAEAVCRGELVHVPERADAECLAALLAPLHSCGDGAGGLAGDVQEPGDRVRADVLAAVAGGSLVALVDLDDEVLGAALGGGPASEPTGNGVLLAVLSDPADGADRTLASL
jgi:hypothetical protein